MVLAAPSHIWEDTASSRGRPVACTAPHASPFRLMLAMVPIGVVGRVLLGPALVDAESWRLGAGPGLLAPLPMDWAGAGVAGFALGAAWGRSFLKPASNGQNVASDAVSG